jgi:hypothetical protein
MKAKCINGILKKPSRSIRREEAICDHLCHRNKSAANDHRRPFG